MSSKQFEVAAWEGSSEGEKILIYGDSGMGKTTLASMLPGAKFIGLDDGGRKILHPVTDENLEHIPGVETFDDIRAVIHQPGLLNAGETLVIDTGTIMEDLALAWTLENVKAGEKGKQYTASGIENYGWGKGFRYLYDTMGLPLGDFDTLAHRGVNLALLCQMQQVEISNAGGANFLCDVPSLQKAHGKSTPAIWAKYVERMDHVLKVGLNDISTEEGKAASTGTRVVFVHGQVHFKAKSRTIPSEYPVVSFEHKADDSIWRMIFDGAWKELE